MLSSLTPERARKGKIVSAEEAVRVIRAGDTVATGGFVGTGFAEEIAVKLEERFLKTGQPRGLTLLYAAGQGDGKDRGLNHLAHEGLIKRVVGGHWGLAPKLQKLAFEKKIEAYNFPQGVISHMFRDIAAHKPRTITTVGLGTFVDPRNGGGKINERTTEDLVELMTFDGKEYLAYRTMPVHVAILRGTTADTDGNITMEREALTLDSLSMAMAAKNSNGFVIVQVERIADRHTLKARDVKIPGIMVDCVVVSKPEYHWQTFLEVYNPSFSTAGGLKLRVEGGKLQIEQEGKVRKFVKQVEHVTFSGKYARMKRQPVLYVTERCVFGLMEEGVELLEVAPGIDVDRDILALMDFKPIVTKSPLLMDERIFRAEPMNLKQDLLALTLEERLNYDPSENLFFVNFEGYSVRSSQQIREIREAVARILAPLGKKVYTIVNYDNFSLAPDLVDEYTEMVKEVVDRFYTGVSRYTTSTFLRMKLGDALKKRDVAPYIFESPTEARKAIGKE